MAYGGGYWNPPVQNKFLPGTYVAFSSKARPTNIFGERGYVGMALDLPWGAENKLIIVEPADLQKESMQLFGLEYTDPELLPLRELLKHSKVAYIYRLNSDGEKAKNTATGMTVESLYSGIGGNDITITINSNIDLEGYFDVVIRKKGIKVYENTVNDIEALKDNGFVSFSGELEETAGITLTGGTNGTSTTTSHTTFLELLEKKYINIVAYAGTDDAIKRLYDSYVQRRVAMEGAYFQGVLYNFDANSELIINVTSKNTDLTKSDEAGLIPWVAGAEAGCEINRTVGSKIYDGELKPFTNYKQRDLVNAIKEGKFVFHEANKEIRVLMDINSFTNFELYKNEDFSKNQIMRVLHQIGNDWSAIFNQYYLDKVPNDELGRTQLWNDFHNHATKLQGLRAITDLQEEDLIVERGEAKDAVYSQFLVKPVMAMNKLYLEVIVE